ncbi:MAG: DNA translocase FtsK, partial [bacterium]|nr:DNA translocase FtsK [bacterium]
ESEYVPAIADIPLEQKSPSPRKKKNKEAEGEQELPLMSPEPEEIQEVPIELKKEAPQPFDEEEIEEETHEIFSGQLTDASINASPTTRYKLPTSKMLTDGDSGIKISQDELQRKKDTIQETLENFKIKAHMGEAFPGPRVTLYEIIPEKGVRIEKISSIQNNLAMELQASQGIRIIAPIPGRRSVGVEVPNDESSNVWLRGMVDSKEFKNSDAMLPIVLGKDISGKTTIMDLAKAPH